MNKLCNPCSNKNYSKPIPILSVVQFGEVVEGNGGVDFGRTQRGTVTLDLTDGAILCTSETTPPRAYTQVSYEILTYTPSQDPMIPRICMYLS
ncbi:hypothetical protein F511_37606 [Dorcoceras hygrometricum]|uniref:Uncharacterized protein n=1 Tax=Dorcoceras hygrometricum TaxID=472368 RepID=A0A2Z7CXF9_9LAMI|nr:hypothetical protein F511_37606 [Dorcoceras hygrometricum]